nr:TrkA family potassium uptake protein [Clostridia bacterium]
MKTFCIIGLDTFGQTLALTLTQNSHQVMVIDEDSEAINVLADIVTNAVVGDATSEAVLVAAGVKDYECVIVSTDSMNDSILLTLSLKDLGIKKVVVRAVSNQHKRVLEKVGADMVVFPEQDMGEKLAYMLEKNNVMEYIEFSSEYSIVEIKVPSVWIGKSIIDVHVRKRYGVNIIAISRGTRDTMDISPQADRIFQSGDLVTLLGANDNIDKITKMA